MKWTDEQLESVIQAGVCVAQYLGNARRACTTVSTVKWRREAELVVEATLHVLQPPAAPAQEAKP